MDAKLPKHALHDCQAIDKAYCLGIEMDSTTNTTPKFTRYNNSKLFYAGTRWPKMFWDVSVLPYQNRTAIAKGHVA